MSFDLDEILRAQFLDLQTKYPGLTLVQNVFGDWSVKGQLKFSATYGDAGTISDVYEIEVLIPRNFPNEIPSVKDLSGRTKDFHTNHDGTLCLGAPLAVRIAFSKAMTLLGFVENCMINFLYSCSYKNLYGKLPFGDLPHGNEGIFQYYQEFFGVNDGSAVLNLLRVLADDDYRGHLECPCGSGAKTRSCHGDQLKYANSFQKTEEFILDYLGILVWLHEKGEKIPLPCFSKKLSRNKRGQPEKPQNR
jgi:hypothetical protein